MLTLWALHVFGPTMVTVYKWIVAFTKDPFRYILVSRAYRAPGNGIHIAKLIKGASKNAFRRSQSVRIGAT